MKDLFLQPMRQLRANDFAYRLLLRDLDRLRKRGAPRLPERVEEIAHFAWSAHPGRFTDGAVENVLLDIGRDLDAPPPAAPGEPRRTGRPTRTLHVATELYVTGGHSRVLAKWVERDLSSSHAIVVTRQRGNLPDYLTAIAAARGAAITVLDRNDDVRRRAGQLRALSREFDRVILHHHPDDAVPVVAYAVSDGCPVAMFNHAHFSFSLGSGVADVVINTMPYFRQLTDRYRFPLATGLLEGPLGLDRLVWSDVDKPAAKRRLGLPPASPVALTIGAEAYFAPSGDVDFFATLGRLLAACADLHVLVVGVGKDSPLVSPAIRATGRVHLAGRVTDPRPWYEAADICLESFPMPSLGALTEAVAYGQAFPVPAYAEAENPLRVNQQRVGSVAVRQRTEADYVRYVLALLDEPEATRGRVEALRRLLVRDDERFGDQFEGLYALIDRAGHRPRDVPVTSCVMSSENVVLASRTVPGRFRDAIALLPVRDSIGAHARATIAGYERPGAAAFDVARDLVRPVARRIRSR